MKKCLVYTAVLIAIGIILLLASCASVPEPTRYDWKPTVEKQKSTPAHWESR